MPQRAFERGGISCVLLLALTFSSLGVTPAQAADINLRGYWALDDGSGTTAADSSGYGHPGTLSGGGWSVSHAPTSFANSGSLSLDGGADRGNLPAVPLLGEPRSLDR